MTNEERPERIAFLLLEEFTHLAFSCAVEPLRLANLLAERALYDWRLLSESGAPVACSNGAVTQVDAPLADLDRGEAVFVLSGMNVPERATPAILAALRRAKAHGTRIGGICSGAYVLARAGFLDGRRATIHWAWHDLMRELFSEVELQRSVYVVDEAHPTASGGTAAADMMLHLIARDHGRELALGVSDQMLYNAVREGGASQRISLQSWHGFRSARLVKAIAMIEANVETPLAPVEIARKLGISVRQLERLFGKYLQISPKRFIMDMRLDRARALIQQTDRPISEIAMASGFSSTSHFAKVYAARFGVSATKHRVRFE